MILHNSCIISLFYIYATQANLTPVIHNKMNIEGEHETLKIIVI